MDPASAALVAILALAAGTQAFLGFGFGIVAMCLLTLSHDLVHAAGVVNVTGIFLTSSLLVRLRSEVLWSVLGRMAPGVVVGVAAGVTALRFLDRTLMVRGLGLTIVVIAVWNLVSPRLRHHETPTLDVVMGALGGALGGAFNTGGPPIVAHLYTRGESPEALKATVQALFLTIGLSRLPLAASQGMMAGSIWWDAALGAPAVLLGSAAGLAVASRVSPERFRRLGWVSLGALGVLLLIRA